MSEILTANGVELYNNNGSGVLTVEGTNQSEESGGTLFRMGVTTEETLGEAELDNKEICIITTAGEIINSGETYNIILTSNLITAVTGFAHNIANASNAKGFPIIESITPSSGSAVIRILNVGAQASSDDTDGTLVLTILILN